MSGVGETGCGRTLRGGLGCTGGSLPLGLGSNSKRLARAQQLQLGAFTGRRQTELQLILCNPIDFKGLVIFRARDPWPFHAAAGTAWYPLDALVNACGEFGHCTGSPSFSCVIYCTWCYVKHCCWLVEITPSSYQI